MMRHNGEYNTNFITVIVLFIFVSLLAYYFYSISDMERRVGGENRPAPTATPEYSPAPEEEGVFCTLDAKLCPDGSYVGRTPPNCEFAPCPGETSPDPDTDV